MSKVLEKANPTIEQAKVILHQGNQFVKACPGAGKTRTLVERLIFQAEKLPPKRGIAVLSFTNAAIDEITEQCAKYQRTELLESPFFIGTFDSFVNSFLVTPFGIPGVKKHPRIISSWSEIVEPIRIKGSRLPSGLSLDELTVKEDGSAILEPQFLKDQTLRNAVLENPNEWQRIALWRRRLLIEKGIISCRDARAYAIKRIREKPFAKSMGKAIAARFSEVFVDEAQDCNPYYLEILKWLIESALPLTIVCDPDQAIYEFRESVPEKLVEFVAPMQKNPLTGNFRSAPAICHFAKTFRVDGLADKPLGPYKNISHKILLLPFTGRVSAQIGGAYLETSQALGFGQEQCVVLAHGEKDAKRAAGIDLSNSGNAFVIKLYRAKNALYSEHSTATLREKALRDVETILLEFKYNEKYNEYLPESACHEAGIEHRFLRRTALQLLKSVPELSNREQAGLKEWLSKIKKVFLSLGILEEGDARLSSLIRKPQGDDWHNLILPEKVALKCMTVHQAKGRAFDSVLLVIPPKSPKKPSDVTISHWQNKTDSEAKRVLYVGATRARQYLTVAVPQAELERISSILDKGNVPYEVKIEGSN